MSKTLLLADDSVVIQKLVGLSFANEDVEIVSTDNGDDAVSKAREVRPDVVLADVVMPGKSGYEVCEAIKQDPALAHIPVLLLTGTFEAFDESRATGAGADGHITKPFEAQALVERVKTVIKNARPPAPARANAPVTTADDLFDEPEAVTVPPAARAGLFGRPDSLDVTPSLSEDDLNDALDVDLFGPPGSDVGGPSLAGALGSARSASLESPLGSSESLSGARSGSSSSAPSISGSSVGSSAGRSFGQAGPASAGESNRFADSPIEDATIAILPPAMPTGSTRASVLADDLGFDEPIEVAELPLAAFDLDSAFDPAPPPAAVPAAAPSLLQVAQDDSNAATSPSLDRIAPVTNLDDLLAIQTSPRSEGPPPLPRAAFQPESPTLVDLDRELDRSASNRVVSDLDFGFDVSEQAPVSQVDLLEESFTSLLDVSESQLLGDPASTRPPVAPFAPLEPSPAAASPKSPSGVAPSPITDFDVSSSDLAAASPLFPAPSASPTSPSPKRTPPDLDDFMPTGSLLPAADPASRASRPSDATSPVERSAGGAAVAHLSPILQQQVQETLEKVAWEAFSDLSETIVKQVIERVERIAWEVIPQMADTLIREEIRQLKGEED